MTTPTDTSAPTPRPSAEGAARAWLKSYRSLQETFDVRDDHVSIALSIAAAAFIAGAKWEREECAKVADEQYSEPGWCGDYKTAAATIAHGIRARASADELLKG